jgi:hypothetical protein
MGHAYKSLVRDVPRGWLLVSEQRAVAAGDTWAAACARMAEEDLVPVLLFFHRTPAQVP